MKIIKGFEETERREVRNARAKYGSINLYLRALLASETRISGKFYDLEEDEKKEKKESKLLKDLIDYFEGGAFEEDEFYVLLRDSDDGFVNVDLKTGKIELGTKKAKSNKNLLFTADDAKAYDKNWLKFLVEAEAADTK